MCLKTRLGHLLIQPPVEEHYLNARDETEGESPRARERTECTFTTHGGGLIRAFRRKQDAAEYPNHVEFGLRKGVQFPEGFNSGQEVVMILDRVALPYSDVKNFNDLPIPFACVATDLVISRPFVFRDGSLSLALRSTLSLPGVFSPVRWDGHIFADGGLMDNLPVDVARRTGADLTLAVHLESAKLDSSTTLSSFGVLGRSVSVVIAANELRGMEKATC